MTSTIIDNLEQNMVKSYENLNKNELPLIHSDEWYDIFNKNNIEITKNIKEIQDNLRNDYINWTTANECSKEIRNLFENTFFKNLFIKLMGEHMLKIPIPISLGYTEYNKELRKNILKILIKFQETFENRYTLDHVFDYNEKYMIAFKYAIMSSLSDIQYSKIFIIEYNLTPESSDNDILNAYKDIILMNFKINKSDLTISKKIELLFHETYIVTKLRKILNKYFSTINPKIERSELNNVKKLFQSNIIKNVFKKDFKIILSDIDKQEYKFKVDEKPDKYCNFYRCITDTSIKIPFEKYSQNHVEEDNDLSDYIDKELIIEVDDDEYSDEFDTHFG